MVANEVASSSGLHVAIVNEDNQELSKLKDLLMLQEWKVDGIGQDLIDAVTICKEKRPDILIVDLDSVARQSVKVGNSLVKQGFCKGIIFLTGKLNEELVSSMESDCLVQVLEKPVTYSKLALALKISSNHIQRLVSLENEVEELKQQLADRKMIDRAKSILMNHWGWTEKEAHRYIQKESMKKQTSMVNVAEVIIYAHTGE